MSALDVLLSRSEWQQTPRSLEIGDCLVWTGWRDRWGYGRFDYSGHELRAHRAAWIERHGQPPAETPWVLHRCDNPPCWADSHLFLGTHADNMADMVAKGRQWNQRKTECPAGHPYAGPNLYLTPDGKRMCRACNAQAARRYKARLVGVS